jgi:hypothetical protein
MMGRQSIEESTGAYRSKEKETHWDFGQEWVSQPVEQKERADEIVLPSYLLDFVICLGKFVLL